MSKPGNATRMLERRVSNNRTDLNGDGQMNYFLSWFNSWTDLQRSDFVAVLAEKFGNGSTNGEPVIIPDSDSNSKRPPSLYQCQVKLFSEWFAGWSDDQKNYLTLRLKEIDPLFFRKYEEFQSNPDAAGAEKDYFEPGVPDYLVQKKAANSSSSSSPSQKQPQQQPQPPQPPPKSKVDDEHLVKTITPIVETLELTD